MNVVLPSEGDSIVVEGDETMVGDGNAVGVASQVVENMFSAAALADGLVCLHVLSRTRPIP